MYSLEATENKSLVTYIYTEVRLSNYFKPQRFIILFFLFLFFC